MKPFIVAITGASGSIYGIRLVQVLAGMNYDIALIVSKSAREVITIEQGIQIDNWNETSELVKVFGTDIQNKIQIYDPDDFLAPVASGSYPVEGMIIAPCSMGTLGAIAGGVTQNLIHRAADCALKECRPLALVPRETPLSAIHLENMLKLARLGVRIIPAMPAFYSGAKEVDQLVDFVVGKILDQVGIVHMLYARWTGSSNI